MSNTEQIKESLEKLLNGNNPFVAMISGEWGIGKTCFWKKKIKKDERKAYISLFGHNSLDDIKSAIMTEVSMLQHDKLKNLIKKANDLQIEYKGVSVSGLFSMLTKEDLENIIICFDDFERLSNNLDLKDVLGLISYLKEEKKCKIVMILNENELDIEVESHGQSRSKIFAKKKEKIVDYSFHYMPSYDESFEIVRTDIEYFNEEWIKSFFEKIELKNIRIMKQVISQLNHFAFIGKYNLDDKVIEEFVEIALNLFVFKAKCNLSYEEYNNICIYKFNKALNNALSESELSQDRLDFKENKEYDKCISHILEFESSNKDKLEKLVYDFIDTMIIDEDNLKSLLSENDTNVHYYTIRKEILSLINDYRYNFKVDDEKVSEEINKIIIKYKDELHHIYTYESFKNIKQKHLQDVLDLKVEKEIIKNYIKSYPKSGDPIFDSHATIELIKKDCEWIGEYISSLHTKFDDIDISKSEIKKIMSQYARDGSYNIFNSSHKLNSISIEKFQSFITEDKEFVDILIKFLIKRPVPNGFKVNKAIESIKKALLELKKKNDIYARKVDFIVEKAKIKFEK